MSEKKEENKYFCFLVNAKTDNILMHFFILTEPSTDHNLLSDEKSAPFLGTTK